MRAILLKYLHLRESKDEFQNLKASFTLWCGNFMWLDIGIGLFRQSGVESQTLLIICCFRCVDKKSHVTVKTKNMSPDNSLSVHLSLVGFPNQMFYAKYFSSVLSPSMTRSPAVMLSPHQWSMPCPILSPTFCFSYQASAPHIILCHWNTHFKHSNFWHHGGKGGEVGQNGKGWGSWKRPWAMKKIR